MAQFKWVNSAVLDNGINAIKTNVTQMLLISNYAFGDTYGTVAANKLAAAVMTSADFTITTSGNNRVLSTPTTGSKTATATATAGGTPNLHFAFTNGVDTVYWVTPETTDQPTTSGNIINFPQLTYTSQQPT